MSEWSEVSLDELVTMTSGKPIKPGSPGPIVAFGSNGIIGGAPEARHQRGIIVGRVGAYCGSVAVSNAPFWASDNTIVLTPRKESDLNYLYYLLLNANLNRHAGGAAQPLITQTTLKGLTYRVPVESIRIKVGQVLRTFDDLIENNRRRIALLEQVAQAIYREWFVYFRYPGYEDDEFVDSPLGPTPAGWSPTPLGELGPAITESVDPSEVDPATPSVGLENLPRRSFTLSDWGRASDLTSRKTRFTAGDVLFGKIRPYFHKVCVASVDGIASTDAIVVRPLGAARGLVTMTMFSDDFVAHAVATSNGTKMPRADWKVLREWLVPVPPETTLLPFEEAVALAVDSCNALAFQSRTLAALRDLLLPKLVTGAIDVSKLDLDSLLEESAA